MNHNLSRDGRNDNEKHTDLPFSLEISIYDDMNTKSDVPISLVL